MNKPYLHPASASTHNKTKSSLGWKILYRLLCFQLSEPRVGALCTGMREFSVILPKKEYFLFYSPYWVVFLIQQVTLQRPRVP